MSSAEPVRVLLADDDALVRELAGAMLESSGFDVQAVASGDAAIGACALRMPEIILLDVHMPDGDGYETCASIRALPGGERVPIIMVTGLDDSSSIDRAYEVGATDFVVKPINWTLLAHRLRYVLRGARTLEALRLREAHIHRLAYYDVLTDLPNREWLGEHLSQALEEARRDGHRIALLYVDLDQFKRINDTLGHGTGDALLRQVALRLTEVLAGLGAAGTGMLRAQLTRVGGDEFVIVLAGNPTLEDAQRTAELVRMALGPPLQQGAYQLVVTPSVGIALYPEHGEDLHSLLKNADGAMYEAKASGRNRHQVYTSALAGKAMRRLALEMELRRALEQAQLEVYYQPKYGARTLEVLGAEALLRWFHPERGLVPTADFIAVAEETGLIAEVDRWVLERVCRDLTAWRAAGLEAVSIAVNLSGRDFMHPESILRICDTVDRARLPAHLFELELTEGVLMRDAEGGRRSLLALKKLGFAIAVDDFGTGYSSLSYLKRFPLDTLKIDRSFVEDVCVDPDDAAIVRSIIALGHNLNLKIVAEGVATEAQLRFLQMEGCDALQGFLLSAAVPAADFATLLASAGPSRAAGATRLPPSLKKASASA
ncbi:MAG: EAL domain-containing protein [Steroidobacteraceae bacterium]